MCVSWHNSNRIEKIFVFLHSLPYKLFFLIYSFLKFGFIPPLLFQKIHFFDPSWVVLWIYGYDVCQFWRSFSKTGKPPFVVKLMKHDCTLKKKPYNLNLVEFSCVLACFKANKQPLMWLQVSVWRGLLWFSNFLVRFLHYITVCNSQRGLSPN